MREYNIPVQKLSVRRERVRFPFSDGKVQQHTARLFEIQEPKITLGNFSEIHIFLRRLICEKIYQSAGKLKRIL